MKKPKLTPLKMCWITSTSTMYGSYKLLRTVPINGKRITKTSTFLIIKHEPLLTVRLTNLDSSTPLVHVMSRNFFHTSTTIIFIRIVIYRMNYTRHQWYLNYQIFHYVLKSLTRLIYITYLFLWSVMLVCRIPSKA